MGDYEIVGTLGYGGMGEVYRVRHSISDRMEAMKLLRAAPGSGLQAQEMMDRFVREIRLLATLQHPNIATLHTAFRHEEQLVMVMECVEGEDLGRRLPAGLTLEESLRYTRQVLEALRYAHGRGIVHRDIKPSNIMITPQGEVKLLDFGLALGGLALGGADQRLTTTGALVGSMHYIAPEHISGEPHDARSDIYAVGVTLYEMITGRLPIEGTTHIQVIAGHLQHAPVPPEQIHPKIPSALSATVMRALKKNPRERWQTAEAFLAALDEDGLRSTPAGDVSQVRVTQAPAPREPRSGSPQPSSAHRPESLSEITRQLAEHVGPIAGVLVRRASSSSTNLREMCDA
ncbi:MAG: eukaryotic-like serine/threonine-protein kinase, partial [Acidobacteriaceae bacterium]|nr:eukaryotic-like serine/threonine-protein kinase [Acidobacteriaceae bacterium]